MDKSCINVDVAVAMSVMIISMVVNMIVAVGVETNVMAVFLIVVMLSLMAFFICEQGLLDLIIIYLLLCLFLSMVMSV